MQGFEEILIELLLRHNCVVVPGFGGFVAKQISAQIDFEKGLVNAPKKELLFNRFLLTDDGLFLSEYSRRNGLFYEEAKNKLQAFTDQILQDLRSGQPVKIPKIGTFVRQQDGQIRFDQDRFFNLLLSSYGLGNLSFVAKEIETEKEAPIVALPVAKEERKPIQWARIAAAACFIPMAFYSVWIPTKTTALSSGLFSISDFNPFQPTGAAVYQKNNLQVQALELPAAAPELQLQATSNPRFSNYYWDASTQCKVKVPKQIAPKEFAQVEATTAGGFDVIVGCFSNAQNAQNLVLKLQRDGFAARIIPGGTLIRVSAGNAHDAVQLAELQQRVSARQLQGWIYKN
jgi:cell division septation protein DedD